MGLFSFSRIPFRSILPNHEWANRGTKIEFEKVPQE